MGKRRRLGKLPRGERFQKIELWELESPAYKALSSDAIEVYQAIRQRMNFDASNNGEVVFSQLDAQKVLKPAFHRKTAAPGDEPRPASWRRAMNALCELQHYGFIRQRNRGRPSATIRVASEWQLTAFECGGQPASKAFMRWKGEIFERLYRRTPAAAAKQAPTCTVQVPHLHGAGAQAGRQVASAAENDQTTCTVQVVSTEPHLHGAGTSTPTSQGAAEGPRERARASVAGEHSAVPVAIPERVGPLVGEPERSDGPAAAASSSSASGQAELRLFRVWRGGAGSRAENARPLPLEVARELTATLHHTAAAFGSYFRLRVASWQQGGLDPDPEKLMRIVGCHRAVWNQVERPAVKMFEHRDGLLVDPRDFHAEGPRLFRSSENDRRLWLHPAAERRTTRHLTPAAYGCLLRLRMVAWELGGVDPEAGGLIMIARCHTQQQWGRVEAAVLAMLEERDGLLVYPPDVDGPRVVAAAS